MGNQLRSAQIARMKSLSETAAMPDTMIVRTRAASTSDLQGGRIPGAETTVTTVCDLYHLTGQERTLAAAIHPRAVWGISYPTTITISPKDKVEINSIVYEVVWVADHGANRIHNTAWLVGGE